MMNKVENMVESDGVLIVSHLMEEADLLLAEAGDAIAQNNDEVESICSSQSVSILNVLRSSLDEELGGDLAIQMRDLYDYMINRILGGFQLRDHGYVEEVRKLLSQLMEGWNGMSHLPSVDAVSVA